MDSTTGKCPILFLGYQEKYNLSDEYVKQWCYKGCCPDCADMMRKSIERRRKNEK